MEKSVQQYKQAVSVIKEAILHSQYRAAKMVTGEELSLNFGIGAYVSNRSRQEKWGTSIIDSISEQLRRELPGLRGFSARSIRNMRTFYEYWKQFLIWQPSAAKLQLSINQDTIDIECFSLQKWSPVAIEINREEFLGISFSHHLEILQKTKDIQEVLFYIHQTVLHKWDKYDLRNRLKEGLYQKQGAAANNFLQTMPVNDARKAVGMFKDEYLLDYINVEEMEVDNPEDVDEKNFVSRHDTVISRHDTVVSWHDTIISRHATYLYITFLTLVHATCLYITFLTLVTR